VIRTRHEPEPRCPRDAPRRPIFVLFTAFGVGLGATLVYVFFIAR